MRSIYFLTLFWLFVVVGQVFILWIYILPILKSLRFAVAGG